MKITRLKNMLLLAIASMLAAACAPQSSIDQMYNGMTSTDFAIAAGDRSIFSSHNF